MSFGQKGGKTWLPFAQRDPKVWRKINLLDRLGKESSQLVAGVCPSSLPYRDRQDNLADIVTGEWDNIFVNVRVTEGLSA